MQARFTHLHRFVALLILFFTLGTGKTWASHYAAIDMTVRYDCSGPTGMDYKVSLDVYFACEPGSSGPSSSETISYFSANEGGANNVPYDFGNRSKTATLVGVEDVVDQLCDKTLNSCVNTGNPYPGFRHRRFEATISLTSRQTDWVFYASDGARNSGILNITTVMNGTSPSGNIFVEAGIDNQFRSDNESPAFAVNPLPYICINQPATYLCGPFDIFSDSLEVLNVLPRQNFNTPYFYQSSYSAANPIASTATDPYTVDPATGTATFTPTISGKFVLAFRLNKYDRKTGKLIGYTYRDVQVNVLSVCSGTPPDVTDPQNVTGGAKTPDGKYTTCTGNAFKFDINGSTATANRKLYLAANLESIPGSQLITTGDGSTSVDGVFSWTPSYGNIGEHLLIITAFDSTCDANSPIVLKKHKVVLVKVLPGIDVGADKTFCALGGSPVELYARGGEGTRLKWSDISGGPAIGLSNDTIANPVATPKGEVTYMVLAPDLPVCKNADTINLTYDKTVSIDISPNNPIILCRPDYLQLDAQMQGRPPVAPIPCGLTSTADLKPLDSLFVNGNLDGFYDTLGPVTPTFPNDAPNVKQQFLIRRGDIIESGLLYHTLKGISFNVITTDPAYQYTNLKISIKCTPELSVSCTKNFQAGMTQVYAATGPVTLALGENKFMFDKAYNWDTSQNMIIQICYSGNPVVNPAGSNPIIRFVPTDYVSDLSLSDPTVDVCPLLASTSITRSYARPQFRFFFTEPVKPLVLTWSPGTFLSDSTIAQPLAYVPKSITYFASTIGRNGCIVKDSAEIYIPRDSYTQFPADTAICYGEPAPLHARGGFTYKWYTYKDGVYTLATHDATCWDCADPILTPKATTIYKIVVYDSLWCTDTLTARVEVMPLPNTHILNKDTIIKYGQPIQLMVSGARTYNWFQTGSLNNTNVANPIARPTERTQYVVGGIGKNQCRSFDTVTVDVDFRDNLFIPSAFSPNGDGKNDMFHITNLSFQKVMEFRVFNRWGQEVFYSNDNQHGWDGKWKGVPQDLGNYQYLIRLGYPDGLVETYKGEVTLVR